MKRSLVLIPVLTILITAGAFGQVSQNAVPFLLIAPGARAGGMGETFVAIADDASATHWNPAGLGRYPLSTDWLELAAAEGVSIEKIALVKNDIPIANYTQFDIWAIVNGRLARYDEGVWMTSINMKLEERRSLKSILMRFTGLNDEEIDPYYNTFIEANNKFPLDRVVQLEQKAIASVPEDYQYRDQIVDGFDNLKGAWGDLKIATNRFYFIENKINDDLADGSFSTAVLDEIAFSINRVVTKRATDRIEIPLDLILGSSSVNCLESQDGMLYVGTNNGFFRFDPRRDRWKSYQNDDNPGTLNILSMAKWRRRSVVLGTDNGVIYFDGAKIKQFASDANPPAEEIISVTASGNRDIWIATKNDIYSYQDEKWLNYKEHEVSIGEDITKIVNSYYGNMSFVYGRSLDDYIKEINKVSDEPAVGTMLVMPFHPAFRGQITTISKSIDDLWIGTSTGLVRYDNQNFTHYGYKIFSAEQDVPLADLARPNLPDPTPSKINHLVQVIKKYNNYDKDIMAPGDRILIYSNTLGSPINTIAVASPTKVFVGSAFGVIEYNGGAWSRFAKADVSRTATHTIKTENGELWLATDKAVYILSKAQKQVTFMHSNYLKELDPDIYFEFLSIVYPTDEWGTFGLGFTYL